VKVDNTRCCAYLLVQFLGYVVQGFAAPQQRIRSLVATTTFVINEQEREENDESSDPI
jgi:hypothetical protein